MQFDCYSIWKEKSLKFCEIYLKLNVFNISIVSRFDTLGRAREKELQK